MNIQTAAEKWGLTHRRIQDMCKNGDIVGAYKLGKVWIIPEEAEKPLDKRIKHIKAINNEVKGRFLFPAPRQNPFLIHTDLYHTPGMAEELVAEYSEYPDTALIIESQFDYRRGNIEKIYKNVDYFLSQHAGFNSTISAGILLSYCAIWKGDVNLWHQARRHIYNAPCKTENDRRIIDFWLAVIDSNIGNSENYPEWFTHGKFDYLPADTFCTARTFYVKYLYLMAHDVAMGKKLLQNVEGLGLVRTLPYVIEPMISQAKMEKTVVPEIYLHLKAGVVYRDLGDMLHAANHVDRAIELCLPDKLFGILCEYRSNLGTLLDDRLGSKSPAALSKVRELHREMNVGWVKLHNALLSRNVAAHLTTREREVARLAAFGFSNSEIAQRLHIEISSVKQYVFTAMNKLGAEKRGELGQFI